MRQTGRENGPFPARSLPCCSVRLLLYPFLQRLSIQSSGCQQKNPGAPTAPAGFARYRGSRRTRRPACPAPPVPTSANERPPMIRQRKQPQARSPAAAHFCQASFAVSTGQSSIAVQPSSSAKTVFIYAGIFREPPAAPWRSPPGRWDCNGPTRRFHWRRCTSPWWRCASADRKRCANGTAPTGPPR